MATIMRVPAVARSRFGFGRMVFDKRLLTRERVTQYLETIAGDRGRRLRLKQFFRSIDEGDLVTTNQQIRELHMPTMIIWGGDDACRSSSSAKTLYDAIPGARRLELIPFAGASCHEERPDLFARLLTDFFDELGSGTKG
jgi:pimeloyl-ACP methyl ester carboxylesterase